MVTPPDETTADPYAVIAITSAEIYRALQNRTDDLQQSLEYQTATSDVLKVISRSTFDLQPVLETVVQKAVQLCDADFGAIALRQGDSLHVGAACSEQPDFLSLMRGLVVTVDRGSLAGRAVVERSSYILSRTPARIARPAPALGCDTAYVLENILGYSSKRIEELRARSVLD